MEACTLRSAMWSDGTLRAPAALAAGQPKAISPRVVAVVAPNRPRRAGVRQHGRRYPKAAGLPLVPKSQTLAARLLEKLEEKAKVAASTAADRAIQTDAAVKSQTAAFLGLQRGRMSEWWSDHLAMKASATDAIYRHDEEEEALDTYQNHMGGWHNGREAESDIARAALREWYYPRSDPGVGARACY